MNAPATPVDEERTSQLALAVVRVIRRHLAEDPPRRDLAYEALNALAINVALMLGGTEFDRAAFAFFDDATIGQCREIARERGLAPGRIECAERERAIAAALREALLHRGPSSLIGAELTLTFADDAHALDAMQQLNRLVMTDEAAELFARGTVGGIIIPGRRAPSLDEQDG